MITPHRNLPNEIVHSSALIDPSSHLDPPPSPPRLGITKSQSFNLAEREKAALMAALDQCNGNKKKAAELLGIHRPTLYTKLKKFGLGV